MQCNDAIYGPYAKIYWLKIEKDSKKVKVKFSLTHYRSWSRCSGSQPAGDVK